MGKFKRTKKPSALKTPKDTTKEFIWIGGIQVRSLDYKRPGTITPEESLEADRNVAFCMLKEFRYQPWMKHVLTPEEIDDFRRTKIL
jgi:hypothetical protein